MATLNVQINVNQYQLILQDKQKPQYNVPQIQEGPINTYEPRFDKVNFTNHRINEVIGWMLIIGVLLLLLTLGLSITQDSVVGLAIPLLSVVTFLSVYLNWVSMKFFINS